MSNNKLKQVVVYGLGAMGRPIARNLHKHKLLRGVRNRTSAIAKSLTQELGLTYSSDAAELYTGADCVLTCVSADPDLAQVVAEVAPHLQPGSVIIDCSTVSPNTARELAEELQTRDIGFIDAPVSGGVEGAKNGTLSIMIGAQREDYKRASEVFAAIGSQITHMGKVGQGQATKAVNQIMVAGIAQTVCTALAFAEQCNLDMKKALEVFSGGAAASWFLENRGATMVKGEYDVGFKLALLHKDLNICQTTAAELGIELDIIEQGLKEYGDLMDMGFGDEDISALIRLKRERFENQ